MLAPQAGYLQHSHALCKMKRNLLILALLLLILLGLLSSSPSTLAADGQNDEHDGDPVACTSAEGAEPDDDDDDDKKKDAGDLNDAEELDSAEASVSGKEEEGDDDDKTSSVLRGSQPEPKFNWCGSTFAVGDDASATAERTSAARGGLFATRASVTRGGSGAAPIAVALDPLDGPVSGTTGAARGLRMLEDVAASQASASLTALDDPSAGERQVFRL